MKGNPPGRSHASKTGNIIGSLKEAGTEHAEQVLFIAAFRQAFPGVRIFAIPNGGWRDVRTAAKLKAEGVSPGVPDLFIPQWRLFIEMKKARGGTVSPAQKDWIEYLNRCGYIAVVAHGAEEAWRIAVKRHEELS